MTPTEPVQPEDRWLNDEIAELAQALITLRTGDEALRFLRDLCTVNELKELGQRWHVARLLDEGVSYHEISDRTGASSATISRVAQWLRYGRDGYRLVLDRQLQDAIYQFDHKQGVVQKIDEDSTQLAEALKTCTPIIITTLQKFPFVTDKVGDLPDRKYAVIVDEAHSSQSGEAAVEKADVRLPAAFSHRFEDFFLVVG